MHITRCGLAVNWDNYVILDAEGNDIPGLYGIGEVVPITDPAGERRRHPPAPPRRSPSPAAPLSPTMRSSVLLG